MNKESCPDSDHLKHTTEGEKLNKAIIVDIDGTLAIRGDRGPFEWHKVQIDSQNYPVVQLINILKNHYTILVFSGRDTVCREETIKWLGHYGVPNEFVYMRPEKDTRSDTIVKKELYDQYVKGKYQVEFVLDDRDSVVKMWREDLNLPCFQVAYGNF